MKFLLYSTSPQLRPKIDCCAGQSTGALSNHLKQPIQEVNLPDTVLPLLPLAILLLASIVAAAPPADDVLIVNKEFYPESFAIYTGTHDIVDIMVPLNQINFSEDDSEDNLDQSKITFFFVEADIKDNGEKDYKGLYVYKNNVAKKLLENGQSSTYAKNDIVYFGAKDGIYKYNSEDMTATKYGTVSQSVIRMSVDTENARVYYLTEDYVLYKYNENEVESTKVEAVKDARDMVFDFDGNMFFYNGQKQLYTYNGNTVTKIEGLPAHPTSVDLVRSPILVNDVFAVVDGRLYEIKANGTSDVAPFKFQSQPTAYAPDTILYQYYAYKKKIYLYNLISLLADNNIEELSTFFEDNQEQFNSYKTTKVSSRL